MSAPSAARSEQESVAALVQRVRVDVTRIVGAEMGIVELRAAAALRVLQGAGPRVAAATLLALAGVGAMTAGVVIAVAHWVPSSVAAFAVGSVVFVVAAFVMRAELTRLGKDVEEALVASGEVRRDARAGRA